MGRSGGGRPRAAAAMHSSSETGHQKHQPYRFFQSLQSWSLSNIPARVAHGLWRRGTTSTIGHWMSDVRAGIDDLDSTRRCCSPARPRFVPLTFRLEGPQSCVAEGARGTVGGGGKRQGENLAWSFQKDRICNKHVSSGETARGPYRASTSTRFAEAWKVREGRGCRRRREEGVRVSRKSHARTRSRSVAADLRWRRAERALPEGAVRRRVGARRSADWVAGDS